jgi:hypothetical protein
MPRATIVMAITERTFFIKPDCPPTQPIFFFIRVPPLPTLILPLRRFHLGAYYALTKISIEV